MNTIKNRNEIEKLREAARLSSEVHREWMKLSLIGMTELELAQWIDRAFRKRGMTENAYPTIVGAGEHALILHAEPTDRAIQEDDLVLVDAGGKFEAYCADITRVRAASGKMSAKQKALYEIVMSAQCKAIAACRPGSTLDEIHGIAQEELIAGCIRARIVATREEFEARRLFPHKTSHWIGREVHDPCAYRDESGAPTVLAEGMVFTVEPGLYVDGVGIRIEDMILVTGDGHEVLTQVPK